MPETAVSCLRPAWAAPSNVQAAVTTRIGGNLAEHVGDDPADVAENRAQLVRALDLPAKPRWLCQIHGTRVARFHAAPQKENPTADAAVTSAPGVVLAVLTADCLPVLLAARDGSAVGVAHAGWRGLAAGVIEATLDAMETPARELIAWFGPAIGAAHYEVDETVHVAFAGSPGAAQAFAPSSCTGHWHCDLMALARARLMAAGVYDITGGGWDTFAEPERFYSYRRDGATGRMASLIWLEERKL